MTVEGCRVILQGFGNVGSNAANLLYEKGYTITGIAEYDGGLFNADGIDIPALIAQYRQRKSAPSTAFPVPSPPTRTISSPTAARSSSPPPPKMSSPAATPPSSTAASSARAQTAPPPSSPTTSSPKRTSSSSPTSSPTPAASPPSYFEWVQDRMGYFWTEAEVNQRLDSIMMQSFTDVIRYAESHNVNNRIAAYMLAIDRVAYTTKQRGIYA